MNLVIVESPTKSKTLRGFLGKNYQIAATMGHIRDLPKGELGVDVENNFKPKYVVPLKARKNVNILKKALEKTETVILATDEDREGEAIAWHLTKALGLGKHQTPNTKPYQRIVFHEITKQAIKEAVKKPREIDMNLVDAQQARRVLDRIVGYKLSPFLWKKVVKGLSAGRVQSVTVRLVVEREKEIKNFKAQEYWSIEALLQSRETDAKQEFKALLIKKDGKTIPKLGIKNKKEAKEIVKDLDKTEYKISNVEKKEVKRNPLPPFTTSTLQQESWKKLRFPAKMTMSLAQQLYERGHITYHRTDSLNLSDLALFGAKKFIFENYGKEYWAGFLRKYKAKGRAQEAHEAIRPTYPDRIPDQLKIKAPKQSLRDATGQEKLDSRQFKLYDLIWRRFTASQMAQAVFDSTAINIEADNYTFRATGQILKFDGFLKIFPIKFQEAELPLLKENEILELLKLIPSQHFTQPAPRYSEATLIKALEQNDIGRPSTYAPTLSTIQTRNYVEKNENKKFQPTEIGEIVNDLLVKHFPKIVNIKFTANMEKDLDKISQGKEKWQPIVRKFYEPFAKNLEKKYEEVSKKGIIKETEKKCPKCGAKLVIRLGRFGKFYACPKFPECKYTEPLEKQTLGIKCPKCGQGEITEKKTKKGKIFYACNQYPKCDFALWDKPLPGRQAGTGENCPKCGSLLVESGKKIKCSNKECDFVK